MTESSTHSEVHLITTPFILHITVNCYLVRTGSTYVLIDSGKTGQRGAIEAALERAGCRRGALKLIVLTHGDFDHCGNAAYLREKYGAPIALHKDDLGMVEKGDMFWNRKPPAAFVRFLTGLFFRLDRRDRFSPDHLLQEGDDLSDRGFAAQVIELPGHSRGNIGLLTKDGDLFCGDLLANQKRPQVWSIVDDAAAMRASVEKVRRLTLRTIYPGHGQPFMMEQFEAAQ